MERETKRVENSEGLDLIELLECIKDELSQLQQQHKKSAEEQLREFGALRKEIEE
jgi:hypothetical protein